VPGLFISKLRRIINFGGIVKFLFGIGILTIFYKIASIFRTCLADIGITGEF
jgi:hypothetical protein